MRLADIQRRTDRLRQHKRGIRIEWWKRGPKGEYLEMVSADGPPRDQAETVLRFDEEDRGF